jgi:hypothetical protein
VALIGVFHGLLPNKLYNITATAVETFKLSTIGVVVIGLVLAETVDDGLEMAEVDGGMETCFNDFVTGAEA